MTSNQMRQGVAVLLFGGALALEACNTPGAELATAQASTEAVPAPASAVVFDVPALIGKNIDQVEQALGKADKTPPPTEEEQNRVGFEWKKTFTQQGYHLLVKYYRYNKQVYKFTLLENPAAREVVGGLEAVANVTPSATAYYIEGEPEPGYRPAPADANTPPKLPRYIGISILIAPSSKPEPPR